MSELPPERVYAIKFSNGWQYATTEVSALDARAAGLEVVEYAPTKTASDAIEAWDQWLDYLCRIEYQLRGHAPFAQAMENLRATIQRSRS